MPRTVNKKTYVLLDMWQTYVKKLLADNPEWWSRYENFTSNYAVYRKAGTRVEEVMNYTRYRKIVENYLTRAKKAIINGEAVQFGRVGKICARRVERDFRRQRQRKVDWGKTRKQELVWSEEKQKLCYVKVIYYTTDDWCRIGWNRADLVTNENLYEFKPSSESHDKKTGFEMEFSQALIKDPLLKYQYLYYPIKSYT